MQIFHYITPDGRDLFQDWLDRLSYARSGGELVLILCAGSKSTQDADISRAVACWRNYLRRSK